MLFIAKGITMKQIEDTLETLELILASAREEFLSKGYEKASLRAITQNAGATTGALYVKFPSKDALFSALVEPVATQFITMYETANDSGADKLNDSQVDDMWEVALKVISDMVEYMYANKDVFTLIINCSTGSSYENFLDKLIEIEENRTMQSLSYLQRQKIPCKEISRQEVHMLVSAQFNAIFEVIRHDTTKEAALKQIVTIYSFFMDGWNKVFGI